MEPIENHPLHNGHSSHNHNTAADEKTQHPAYNKETRAAVANLEHAPKDMLYYDWAQKKYGESTLVRETRAHIIAYMMKHRPSWFKNLIVISHDDDRYAAFKERIGPLADLIVARVKIDGRTFPKGFDANGRHIPHSEVNRMTSGKIAAFLAHEEARTIVANNYDVATIIEDDCDLVLNMHTFSLLKKAGDQMQELHGQAKTPDVLYLSRNPDFTRHVRGVSENLVMVGKTWGAIAYVIWNDAARRYNAISKISFADPVDIWMSDDAQRKTGVFTRYAITPILCYVVPVDSTTVNAEEERLRREEHVANYVPLRPDDPTQLPIPEAGPPPSEFEEAEENKAE